MISTTHRKFGYPDTLIAETEAWSVLLRPQQVTLGALVLIAREPAEAFSALSAGAFADLGRAVSGIEQMLGATVSYKKINYLMLMMVDPDVHFHVIPRYQGERELAGVRVADAGWPGPPDLKTYVAPGEAEVAALIGALTEQWPG